MGTARADASTSGGRVWTTLRSPAVTAPNCKPYQGTVNITAVAAPPFHVSMVFAIICVIYLAVLFAEPSAPTAIAVTYLV